MSTTQQHIDDGGTAFPHTTVNNMGGFVLQPGMSLRDWFAGQALQGMIANVSTSPVSTKSGCGYLAKNAYQFADAVIEARKKDYIIDRGEDK
jgi:hypothetical protein